jgi:hypothetical protein
MNKNTDAAAVRTAVECSMVRLAWMTPPLVVGLPSEVDCVATDVGAACGRK